MAKNLSLRTKLLSTTALAVAGTFWLGASPALAFPAGECVTGGTSSAVTIICSGTTNHVVYTQNDNTTITLNADAHVLTSNDLAVAVNHPNSAIVMQDGSSAVSTGGYAGVIANNSANVTLNGEAEISLLHNDVQRDVSALGVNGFDGANITLNGGSTINFIGGSYNTKYDDHSASGINVLGEKYKITLNGESSINVTGTGSNVQNDYYGILLQNTAQTSANRNTITLNGGSAINVSRNGASTSGNTMGIASYADGDDKYAADITLNNSSINVSGAGVSAEDKYAGIINAGAAARVTLNGSQVNVTGASANDDNKYMGVEVIQANLSNAQTGGLALTNESTITINANGTGEDAQLMGAVVVNKYFDTKVGATTMDGGSTITLNAGGDTKYAIGLLTEGYAPVVDMSHGSQITVNALGGSTNAKYIGAVVAGVDKYSSGNIGRITLNSGSSINITGTGATDSKYLGILNTGFSPDGKYASDITLNDSFINIAGNGGDGNKYLAIMSLGGGPITLNGASQINLGRHYDSDTHTFVGGGTDAKAYVGILAFNTPGDEPPSVVLNGTSSVNIRGAGFGNDTKYMGIGVSGSAATVTLNGHAGVNLYLASSPENVAGIFTGGYDSEITLNDYAHVLVQAPFPLTAAGAAVVMTGDGDVLTMNDRSAISAYSTKYVNGIAVYGNGASITLNDHAILYGGSAANGILLNGDDATLTTGPDTIVFGGQDGIRVDGNFNQIYVQGSVTGRQNAIDTTHGSNSSVTLDSAQIFGGVVGGGSDELTLAGTGTLNQGFTDFGQVTMDGVHWNLATGSTNTADNVDIVGGRLAVNGDLTAPITVHSGGSLGGTGTITGTLVVLAGGTVSPGNSPGTLNVVGPVTFSAGSILDVEIGATAADLLNATGNVTIDPGAIIQPTFFPGADGFVGDIVTGATVTGTFTPGSGAALVYTPGVVSLTASSSSSMNGGMSAGASQGFTFLDTVLSEAQKSASVGKTLWGTALWSKSTRTAASTSSRGFDQHANGGAFGGDVMNNGDFSLGLAAGYLDGDAITSGGGSRTSISGYHAAVYSTYMFSGTYITSALTGAYQDQDAKRNVFAGGVLVGAQGSPEAWLGGVGLGIGHEFPLNNAFSITPRASLGYQHMARDGYSETGGGTGALSLDGINTDTIRGRVGAELALKVADKNALWAIRPSINAALAQEWRAGDTTTTGTFRTTGAAFNGDLDSRDQSYLALGAGVDVTVGYGVTAFVNYDGGVGGDAESSGGWRLGARMEW